MTRHAAISTLALQARAADLAGERALALLSGAEAPKLRPGLDQLAEIGPLALLRLIQRFGLTEAETDLFCLIGAPETGLASAAALAAHPLAQQGRATPALCAEILGSEAKAALASSALLRQSALVELEAGSGFAHRALVLPEAVASALAGAPGPDPQIAAALTLHPPGPEIPPEAQKLAEAILRSGGGRGGPILHLSTADPVEAADIAAAAAARLGLALAALEPQLLPPGVDPARAAQLLNRDILLTETAALIPATPEGRFIAERVQAPCVLWGAPPPPMLRPCAALEPLRAGILPVGEAADAQAAQAAGFAADLGRLVRLRAARGLEDLAERIEPQADWEDLILPPAQSAQLRQLAASRRHSATVLGAWGFRAKSTRGLALTALFSGPSGAGKTMAAEILARALRPEEGALALYRVDLAALTSKYIGETQKNIGRIFDAAERSQAMLLFDEGEALFARRSAEVKDSHDRHANSETAYLLQRLDSYSGVAIVTTNLRAAVDEAFLRRFRAVIDFPFPEAAERARIWRRVLPPELPCEGLDYTALARLAVTGGFIRSMALTGAYLAAEAGEPLRMGHLERAARQEFMKLGKTLSEAELRGFR